MATSFGGTVKLTGESEYRKALRDITSNLKEVSSELKLTTTQFTAGDKTVKETKTSYSNMNNTIQQQKEKINNLRTALSEAEKEYGSNNEKVRTFKTQLNNAETQLVKMESATKKSNKELDEMRNGFEDAGHSSIKFGDLLKANVLSEAIVGGVKALGNAVKEVGSALLGVGKDALNSYADYEQLVGGVETLFKDNANTVEDYANNAYKTAGLSANDYMETITGFSASLLQSLNRDTSKVAEVGNMAVIDMADNANKMGTDMSLIQNAYQGFAKQNYTMLDNLKLGYGGTKEEMQRLLKDAQRVTGAKYDISNLNDVYQAIHVIQGELGVTGTTAKEASTTIQGSVAAMKSSWQNMLTGISTGDIGNIGNLVNNLVDSVMTASINILPRVQEIANGITAVLPEIISKINENLPTVLESGVQILNTLMQGIITNLPAVMESANQIISTLASTLVELLPQIIDGGIQIIVALTQGLAEQLPELVPQIVETVITITNSLLDNIDMIIDAGIQLLIGLADGLMNALPQLIEKAPEIIEKLVQAITNNLPKIVQAGVTLIIKMGEGLIKAVPQLISKIPQIVTSLVKGFANFDSNMKDVGKNLVSGIWEGIKNAKDWLLGKAKEWCGSVLDGIKGFFGIHSPSKVFRDEIGTNLALGLGEGFSNTMKDVSTEMKTAIPTEFDVTSTINRTDTSNKLTLENMTSAFVTAIKKMNAQIIIDKDIAGRFVITTVNDELGEVM
jgi:phage-related protein